MGGRPGGWVARGRYKGTAFFISFVRVELQGNVTSLLLMKICIYDATNARFLKVLKVIGTKSIILKRFENQNKLTEMEWTYLDNAWQFMQENKPND